MQYTRILFLTLIFLSIITPIQAQNLDSSTFTIESSDVQIEDNFNTTAQQYNISTIVSKTAAAELQDKGYTYTIGYPSNKEPVPFSVSVSKTNMQINNSLPNSSNISPTTITVQSLQIPYQISIIKEAPLQTLNGDMIPDTKCNGNTDTCSESLAKKWDSNIEYGLGYNMAGEYTPSDFVDNNYFRPFPNLNKSKYPSLILFNPRGAEKSEASLSVKTTTSTLQSEGTYQTIIDILAFPLY